MDKRYGWAEYLRCHLICFAGFLAAAIMCLAFSLGSLLLPWFAVKDCQRWMNALERFADEIGGKGDD